MIDEIKAKINQSTIVRNISDFKLEPTTIVCLDIETFGENKLPGDAPFYSPGHGIAGIAVGNMRGETAYLVVNDGRDYAGVPVCDAVTVLNAWLKRGVRVVIFHYAKFDMSFLLARGLDLSGIVVRDTWIISSIKSQGVYVSNKLKEIARDKLGLDTGSETAKDEAMKALNTLDYGDVSPEIMAPYAQNDTRLALLVFLAAEKMTAEEMACHDTYVRNILHVIKAEERGVCLNLPLLKEYLTKIEEMLKDDRSKLKDLLGAAAIDVDNQQDMLKYLHQKNLHPPPRNVFGKIQFVTDRPYLYATEHPLADAYSRFDKRMMFRKHFSGVHGIMRSRIFSGADGQAGFHVQHLASVFSKGGVVFCKSPDFTGEVNLENTVRKLFTPRKGHDFVALRAVDLPTLLLAFYCNDKDLIKAVRGREILKYLSAKLGIKETDPVSVLLRQQIDGFGAAVLEQRMEQIKAKFKGKKTMYSLSDSFVASIAGYREMRERLKQSLAENGHVKDRLGRLLKIEENKTYRAQSILIQSSCGSMLAYYLDIFCRLAYETGGHLVLAHDKEFVFEVPAGDTKFADAARAAAQAMLVEPVPVWDIQQGQVWQMGFLDAHEVATVEL